MVRALMRFRSKARCKRPRGPCFRGATVHVFGTALTTTSDGDGRYTLNFTHAPARLIIVVDLDNYRSDDAVVEIDGPFMATVDFALTPSFSSDVVVIAEVPILNTADDVSRITLAPEQVAVLPSLGERDIFRAF